MNFEDFKYHENNIKATHDEKQIFFEKLRDTFIEELKTQEKYQAFFKKFDPKSVESFIFHYASSKSDVAKYYAFYTDEKYLHKELRYREETEAVFENILQKKLWNLQLQWRAEEIELKEIRTSGDFLFWENHVQSCPFIPAVTEYELELMKQFMLDPNYKDKSPSRHYCGQHYDDLMSKDEHGEYEFMPEWYTYYDLYMGTSSLLLLPDTRGEKEDFYIKLSSKKKAEEAKQAPPKPAYVPPPPYLHFGLDDMYKFAQEFEEDRHFVELFRIRKEMYKPKEIYSAIHDEMVDEAISLLKEADKPVYMPGGLEWREAVVLCSERYLYEIIATELDVVYDEYKMFSEIGISQGNLEDVMKEYEQDYISNLILESVLRGREINGEPRNLDF